MYKSLLAILLLTSCSFNRSNITHYKYYYDPGKTHLKIEGTFVDSSEHGEWVYYSEKGEVAQQGNYSYGIQIGKWFYSYPDLDTSIEWCEFFGDSVAFSLPVSFTQRQIQKGESGYFFVDTLSGSLFAVKSVRNVDSRYANKFFNENLLSFRQHLQVDSAKSERHLIQNQRYYLDKFIIIDDDSVKPAYQYLLYTYLERYRSLLVFAITTRNRNDIYTQFLLHEVFYHFLFNNRRVVNIYDEFTVVKG